MNVGDELMLIREIREEGEDLPPGVIAKSGDMVVIREVRETYLLVSHEPPPYPGASFRLEHDEYLPPEEYRERMASIKKTAAALKQVW